MLLVGTSGWQYRDWRGAFYPARLPVRAWLEEYAARFPTVEVNNTFYRLPERSTFAGWAASVPHGFRFAVKASRYLTHVRRLRAPHDPVQRLLRAASGLGDALGPILLQLPPTLPADPLLLAATLDEFPADVRVAVEFRHDSWHTEAVYDVLGSHDAALCLTDRDGRRGPVVVTAPWCYLRMHSGLASPPGCYGNGALRSWVERIHGQWGGDADGFVFFNNDGYACAPRNAQTFARLAASRSR
jgi:uncharacterized protein YecE (DUF72 family)